MGWFDVPKQPPAPPQPEQSQVSPVSPDAAEWFQGAQSQKGSLKDMRRRSASGGRPGATRCHRRRRVRNARVR
jgi:hypothetical protein